MSIAKHAEATITLKFDFDRASASADAGTGQLPEGVTISSAVVRIMKQVGGSWTDVSAQFVSGNPNLIDSSKAVTQKLKAAGAGEQAATRIPYVAICIAAGSDSVTYVLLDNLEVVATGRASG